MITLLYCTVVLLKCFYMVDVMIAELSSTHVSFLACFGVVLASQVEFNHVTKSCCFHPSIVLHVAV